MMWTAFISALFLSFISVPLVKKFSIKRGKVSEPRNDRWHKKPTPTLGGIAIYFGFLSGLFFFQLLNKGFSVTPPDESNTPIWVLIAGSLFIFLLGIYDDFKPLTPPVKLLGQILIASFVIAFGFTTNFFTPRISNQLIAQFLNVLFTLLWIVGITNALNLIDNMDGLAGGVGLITALMLGLLFWQSGNQGLLGISLALAGAILGFLIFNFPPASIFMGDGGSLFLGFTLAVLAIARQPQASNVFAVFGVPTVLFLLPILDTALVAITRLIRGDSPVKGGSDHTSHRLIAIGLSEKQAVILLYGTAILSGIVAISIERVGYWLSLILVPIFILSLTIMTAYLGNIKILINEENLVSSRSVLSRIVVSLTYKRRILEIVLDIIVVSISLYLAFFIYYGLKMDPDILVKYLTYLPVAVVTTLTSFFIFGVYRSVWKYIGLSDVLRYLLAVAVVIPIYILAIIFMFPDVQIDVIIILLFSIFLFLGLLSTRFSFRLLDSASVQLRYNRPLFQQSGLEVIDDRNGNKQQRVLIAGAGQYGELTLRWLRMNPESAYIPIGFVDVDPYLVGREIHGVEVLGHIEQIFDLLEKNRIDGILLTEVEFTQNRYEQIIKRCIDFGCWVRMLRFDFELVQ